MKLSSFLGQSVFILAGAVGLAPTAHGSPIVQTVAFTEEIVTGTDIFETAGGAMLSTIRYAAWGEEIPPDIASDIANDTSFLSTYPGAASFLQSTASEVALTTDLAFLTGFLTGQLPAVFLTSASATAYPGLISDVGLPEPVLETLFPGFVVTSPIDPITLGSQSYTTGAYDASTNTLTDGTVTFDVYQINLVEQPSAATPEPSPLVLLSPALLALLTFRKTRKGVYS